MWLDIADNGETETWTEDYTDLNKIALLVYSNKYLAALSKDHLKTGFIIEFS